MSSGYNEIVPASTVFPFTTILSDDESLNSIFVVSSAESVKLPVIVRVPMLFPGAKVPAVDENVTLRPITPPPLNVPPSTLISLGIIVFDTSLAVPTYKVPAVNVVSPVNVFVPVSYTHLTLPTTPYV